MSVEKVCPICDETFECPPSQAHRRTTCSVKCAALLARQRGSVEVRCEYCGRLFSRHRSATRRKHCSKKCCDAAKEKKVAKICVICNKKFRVKFTHRLRAKYCSFECKCRAQRKVQNPPNAQQLEHLLRVETLKDIAKMYGVTPKTVSQWCKKVGVHVPGPKERSELRKMTPGQLDRWSKYI